MAKENGDTCPKEQVMMMNACMYIYGSTYTVSYASLLDSVGIT